MKQPRVPEYREGESTGKFLHALVLFLKDFCQDVWTANRLTQKGVDGIKYPVTSVNGKGGDVELGAGDVGALPADGTAKDSEKLGGVEASAYVKADDMPEVDPLDKFEIGVVYSFAIDINPPEKYGGIWEQIKGRMLIGTGEPDTNEDGGSPGSYNIQLGGRGGEASHLLTVNEMPAHTHPTAKGTKQSSTTYYFDTYATYQTEASITAGNYWDAHTLDRGGSQPHNNMSPYYAVNMWQRLE